MKMILRESWIAITTVLIWVVSAEEYCPTREGVVFCPNNCCGPYDDQQCCSFNPTLIVLLVVAATLIILVLAILVIMCCSARKRRSTGVMPGTQTDGGQQTTAVRADDPENVKASSITYVVVPPGESRLFLHNTSTLPPYMPEPPQYSERTMYASGSRQVPISRGTGHLRSVWPIPGTSGTGNVKLTSAPPSYTSITASVNVEPDLSSKHPTRMKNEPQTYM